MFRFLEIPDANPVAQPGLPLLAPVVDCLSLHDKGREKQTLVQIVSRISTSLFVPRTVQSCDGSDGIPLLVCR